MTVQEAYNSMLELCRLYDEGVVNLTSAQIEKYAKKFAKQHKLNIKNAHVEFVEFTGKPITITHGGVVRDVTQKIEEKSILGATYNSKYYTVSVSVDPFQFAEELSWSHYLLQIDTKAKSAKRLIKEQRIIFSGIFTPHAGRYGDGRWYFNIIPQPFSCQIS